MRKVTLPSGAVLTINDADFDPAKALNKIVAREAMRLKIDSAQEIDYNFIKDMVCAAVSSDDVEAAILACADRCLYQAKGMDAPGLRIDNDTFKAIGNRQDFYPALVEVAKDALLPFGKGLWQRFSPLFLKLRGDLTSKSPTTTSSSTSGSQKPATGALPK